MPQRAKVRSLDSVDSAIISRLQEHARDTFAQIGSDIGLSATSIAERVRRLESAGIIHGYHATVSAESLGYALMAFILARPIGPDERFAKLAAERPEILECHRITGDVSFLARVLVSDMKHLESVLNHLEPAASYVVTLLVLSTAFQRPLLVGSKAPD